jgi:hypothetical protein
MHLFCVCVVLCVGSGLEASSSPVQGPTVCVKGQETEKATKVQRAVDPERKKEMYLSIWQFNPLM